MRDLSTHFVLPGLYVRGENYWVPQLSRTLQCRNKEIWP